MEYYGNSRHRKNCGKPIYWLAINPTGGMVDEGERACPGEGATWWTTMDRCERARLIEELRPGPLRPAHLERRPADWLLPPKPKEDVLPPKPKEDTRPPAPEPDAAPFTKEELIDGIADCVAALLAQRDEKIAELGGKLDAVLQILGTGKSGDIIDLPKNFWRRDAA
jgi:hypothetical protein